MTPAQLLDSARSLIENNPDGVGLIDRASLYNVTFPSDGTGGTTKSDGTAIASDVPCLYEQGGHSSTQVAGGTLAHVTHRLYLIASSATRAIKTNYAIVVEARDDMPELRFEQPVILE